MKKKKIKNRIIGKMDMTLPPVLKGLFLDDIRHPNQVSIYDQDIPIEWEVVRTIRDFAAKIDNNKYDVMSFDYYLMGNETGMKALQHYCFQLLDWIDDNKVIKIPRLYFHSSDYSMNRDMQEFWDTNNPRK